MISRGALRYLREANQRQNAQYVCPFCSTRSLSTWRSNRSKSQNPRGNLSEHTRNLRRCYASVQHTSATEKETLPASITLKKGDNVRGYLKQWTADYQEQQVILGNPDQISKAPAFNSLFLKDSSSLQEADVNQDSDVVEAEVSDEEFDSDENFSPLNLQQSFFLKPGDVFMLRSKMVRTQLAMHVDYQGDCARMLLSNGKWLVARVIATPWGGGDVCSNFATDDQIAAIKALIPTRLPPTEPFKQQPYTLGDLPTDLFNDFSLRFRDLKAEYDAFRRDYHGKLAEVYGRVALDEDYISLRLSDFTMDYMGFSHQSAPRGARMALYDMINADPRIAIIAIGVDFHVTAIPKRFTAAANIVIGWARAYQEAAARASSGKDVLPELRNNPLTHFIAKARRLILQSRKIRPLDENLFMGTTITEALPTTTQIEHKPTSETFTDDDKKIIMFIWDHYWRSPSPRRGQSTVQSSAIALVLRAVGAYPDRTLNQYLAYTFLKELGCADPWQNHRLSDVRVQVPVTGINHNLKIVGQREEAAMKQLGITSATKEWPLPDTLANLRKDWGNLEAFAVDPKGTRVRDDAFSIEASDEHPGCTWFHIHTADVASRIPPHHPILARAAYMRQAFHSFRGVFQYLPWDVLDLLTISHKRPSLVMTVSTLLDAMGNVKDVKVVPSIIRNVVMIDRDIYCNQMTDQKHGYWILQTGQRIGNTTPSPSERNNLHRDEQLKLIERYMPKFKQIGHLLRARFEARKRENPEHLRTARKPARGIEVTRWMDSRGPPDLSFDRVVKSEHCYGDPVVLISKRHEQLKDEEATLADYKADSYGGLSDLRTLALESFATWAKERNISCIYSKSFLPLGQTIQRLQNADKHELSRPPYNRPSLTPGPDLFQNLAQHLRVTTPLRNQLDLVNQYQISAYLKAEAKAKAANSSGLPQVIYPYSEAALNRILDNFLDIGMRDHNYNLDNYWVQWAFYQAWKNDPAFPKLFDIEIPNHAVGEIPDQVSLRPFLNKGLLLPSPQQYESSAKPSQYLPVKIVKFFGSCWHERVEVMAVGPATDVPNFPQNFRSDMVPQETTD